jgi:Histidine kinase-, DNA gyrase B-, and HSP90-like ATPase
MPKLRPHLWHVPLLLLAFMGCAAYIRATTNWESFESLVRGRKQYDLRASINALHIPQVTKDSTTDDVRNALRQIAKNSQRNTLIMGGLVLGKSDVKIQPSNPISDDVIAIAEQIWANPSQREALLDDGVSFLYKGKTYHLILRFDKIGNQNWSFLLLTNLSASIQEQYDVNIRQLIFVFVVITIVSVVTTGAIARGASKITRALFYQKPIQSPPWFFSELDTLVKALNDGREKNYRYQLQIEQSTSGHVIVHSPADGSEATMHSPNNAFCKVTGYTSAEIEGKPLNLIVPKEYHPYHYGMGRPDSKKKRNVGMLPFATGCPFHGAAKSEIVGCDRPVEVIPKDKSSKQGILGVEFNGLSRNGSYYEWFGVLTDVTELSRAKAEAEKSAEAEKALRLEFELLQQTWRHDLLSAVLGTDNMFKTLARIGFKVEDPRFKEAYDIAQAKASFAYRLVRDTRDLGVSLENMEKHPMTLAALMESIQILYTEADITYSLSGGERSVLINESSLVGRAVSNLINNAIKFSGLNGIIEVGIRTKDENAIIYVKDNGIGISEEGCKKIFSGVGSGVRMAQDIPGDGFGLHSAKGIVEAHGGEIAVKSELGQGSVFFVKIPLVRDE